MDGLIAENISKTYTGTHGLSFSALRNVSIRLEPGSFTSLVGESGSGKTAYKAPGGFSGCQRNTEPHALCPQ